MLKKIIRLVCVLCVLPLLAQASELSEKGFKKLNRIYITATKSFEKVKSNNDLTNLVEQLNKLKSECLSDEDITELLLLSYENCPEEWKETYLKTVEVQLDLKDASKRLAMSGLFQDSVVIDAINSFMKSSYIQEPLADGQRSNEGAPFETKEHRDKRMKWWRDGKFGMFIHYGLFSGLAGEIQNRKFEGCVEWIQMFSGVDFETYKKEALPRFCPKSGKAAEWVKLAKEAGCAYTVLTSRHHEGFNMFDTKYSDFNVKKVYGVDVIKEYAKACDDYDMKAGYYVSLLDWNHPDYDPTGSGISYPEGNLKAVERGERQFGNHEKYKEYLYNIFDDLLSQYKVDLVWWDFSQPHFQGDKAWGATRLMRRLWEVNPNAIQNNRLYHSDNHLSEGGIKVTPTWKGDYSTAEHHIPATGIDGDWEACQTLNGTWGYSKLNQKWKTTETLIHELVDAVSRGGNYLLNIGPEPDGSIPDESVRLFKEIGAWMKVNGDAIYGTRANPFNEEFQWGRVTRKENNKFYLLVYEKPADGKILLPCTFKKVKGVVLKDGQKVSVSESAAGKTIVDLSDVAVSGPATVIKLTGKLQTLNK